MGVVALTVVMECGLLEGIFDRILYTVYYTDRILYQVYTVYYTDRIIYQVYTVYYTDRILYYVYIVILY